jgi:hypothetical protein
MLDVETNHQIILLYFKEGLSQRKIAQQLKISRKTVKARVAEYERFKSQSASADPASVSATTKYLTEGPAYDSRNRTKRKLTQEIADIIEACLQEMRSSGWTAVKSSNYAKQTFTSNFLEPVTQSAIPPSVNTSEPEVPTHVKHLLNRAMGKVRFASLIGEKLK